MAEKTLTDLPVSLREMYDKGRSALNKGNYDYAIAIFNDLLKKEPGFVACREALRKTQVEKCGQNRSIFSKVFGKASPLLARAQMQVKSNPREAMAMVEQVLNSNPYNAAAQKVLAEAALALEFPNTEALAREIAFNENPTDRDNAMKLADSLLRVGRSEKGQRIMEALSKVFPDDPKLISAYNTWSAKRTLTESLSGGKVESYRQMLQDEKETVTLEQMAREVKDPEIALELIENFKGQLEESPDNQTILQRIADLYERAGQFDNSIEYYTRCNELRGGDDPSLLRHITRCKVQNVQQQIDALDSSAADHEEQLAALEQQKLEIQIEDYAARVRSHPNDLGLRYELGVVQFQAGKVGDAIKQFQRSQDHPAHRISSLKYLGICFMRRRLYDMAAGSFESALEAKELFDDEKKELLYEYGVALEKMGEAEKSITQFKKIYEKDIGFRDVEQRVDDYYAASES